MSKEITKKEETTLANFSNFAEAPQMEFLASMIKLPRLSIMQKTSKLVEDDKAKIGDVCENAGGTVVSPKDKVFKFVPLKINPVITTYEEVEGRLKYKSHVPMTSSNQRYNWEANERGEIHLYLLAEQDLGNDLALPYVFTIKGASMSTFGKSLFTQAALMTASKQPFFGYILGMTNKREEKNGNTYQVAELSREVTKVDPKYYGQIDRWVTTVNNMTNIAVDFSEDEADEKKSSKHGDVQF